MPFIGRPDLPINAPALDPSGQATSSPVAAADATETAFFDAVHATSTSQIATLVAIPVATPQVATPTPTLSPPFQFPTRAKTRINLLPLPPFPEILESVKFIYGDNVTPDKRTAIQNGISLAQSVWGPVGPIAIVADANLDALIEDERLNYGWPAGSSLVALSRKRWEQNRVCETSEGIIFCYITATEPPAGARLHIAMIHEYFHRIQGALSKNARSRGPLWLTEGSAEYAMVTTAARYGFADVETERAYYILHSLGISRGLGAIETIAASDDEDSYSVYSLGYLAAEFLAMNAGDSAILKDYWAYLGQGSNWEIAFEKAFGVTAGDFYRRFDEYRAAEFPTDCDYWRRGTFGIQFHRALPPGSVPRVSADWVPYVFCITSYAFGDLTQAQIKAAFRLPDPSAQFGSCGANCIVIYMRKDLPKGNYTLEFHPPDGRQSQAIFQHQ